MSPPTEPIGSIPRPLALREAIARRGNSEDPALDPPYEDAIRDTVRFEAIGSPVISDGAQRKHHNFRTYCVHGLPSAAPDGSGRDTAFAKIQARAQGTAPAPRFIEGF